MIDYINGNFLVKYSEISNFIKYRFIFRIGEKLLPEFPEYCRLKNITENTNLEKVLGNIKNVIIENKINYDTFKSISKYNEKYNIIFNDSSNWIIKYLKKLKGETNLFEYNLMKNCCFVVPFRYGIIKEINTIIDNYVSYIYIDCIKFKQINFLVTINIEEQNLLSLENLLKDQMIYRSFFILINSGSMKISKKLEQVLTLESEKRDILNLDRLKIFIDDNLNKQIKLRHLIPYSEFFKEEFIIDIDLLKK